MKSDRFSTSPGFSLKDLAPIKKSHFMEPEAVPQPSISFFQIVFCKYLGKAFIDRLLL